MARLTVEVATTKALNKHSVYQKARRILGYEYEQGAYSLISGINVGSMRFNIHSAEDLMFSPRLAVHRAVMSAESECGAGSLTHRMMMAFMEELFENDIYKLSTTLVLNRDDWQATWPFRVIYPRSIIRQGLRNLV